jgi:hypothetical protein
MKQKRVPRWTALVVPLLLCPLLTGCFVPIGYAYPTISHVASVQVEQAQGEVRAFRVDITDKQNCLGGFTPNCFNCGDDDRYVLTALPLSQDGYVPAQTKVALDYSWIWNCVWIYSGQTHHSVKVRLYRPGWQTVEIRSGEKSGRVVWRKAEDLEAQEKAVDDLLSTWETDWRFSHDTEQPPRESTDVFCHVAPGSASAAHRQVLQFAASEYDRLALLLQFNGANQEARQLNSANQEIRRRLNEKANWLRFRRRW